MNNKLTEQMQMQTNFEFFSAYLYLSMSSWADDAGWKGLATWLRAQYHEENEHALMFFDFLSDRNVQPVLNQIEKPKTEWENPYDCFKNILEHEKAISKKINDLAALALSDNDHSTYQFLQWFLKEQIEEENTANDFLNRLERVKDNPAMLDAIDIELGKRTFTSNL